MDTLIATISTVVAVIVGGGITFLTTWMLERNRTERERSERWDVRRLEAFSAFARAVKEEVRILLRVAASFGLAETSPLAPHDALELHQTAEHERSMLFEDLLLLADVDTIQAARAWYSAAWDLQRLLFDGATPPTQNDFDLLYAEANSARNRFHAAARVNLDILRDQADPFVVPDATSSDRRF